MRRLGRPRFVAVVGPLAFGLSACYRYTPIESAVVQPGAAVRLDLSTAGAARLASVLGAGTNAVEGTLIAASDTGYRMSVTGTRKVSTGGVVTWSGEQVAVPRDAVERVQLRRLDQRRTAGIATLAVLGALAIKALIDSFDSSAGGDDGGGTPVTPP